MIEAQNDSYSLKPEDIEKLQNLKNIIDGHEGNIRGMNRAVEHDRVVRQDEEKTNAHEGRWGNWEYSRALIEKPNNLLFMEYQTVLQISLSCASLNSKADEYGNKAYALVSSYFIRGYHTCLDLLAEHSSPSIPMTKSLALRLHNRFVEICDSLLGKAEDMEIDSGITALCSELLEQSSKKALDIIENYNGFREDRQPWEAPKQYKAKITEKTVDEKETGDGWLFYASSKSWPVDKPNIAVVSHSPEFPITEFFNSRGNSWGVVLQGKPVKYFSRDMGTHFDELQLGEDWTIDAGNELIWKEIMSYANKNHISFDQALAEVTRRTEGAVCENIEEAWRKKEGYTEIWLKDPEAVCIWVGKDYENSFYLHQLLSLLESRPDLPIINYEGKIIDRDRVQKVTLK